MTEAQALELISSTFLTAWTEAQPLVPVVLENEALPSVDEFAMLTTAMLGAQQRTHGKRGNRRVKREGWILVKLWSPANAGMQRPAQLADSVRQILEMVSMPSPISGDDPITTQAEVWSRRGSSGEGPDGRWYMSLVRIPFWFRELK